MTRLRSMASVALAALLLAAPASAQDAARLVARVDGHAITEEDVRIALDELASGLPRHMNDKEKRDYAIDYLIDLRIVAAQAAREKLDAGAEFKKRLDQTRDRLLMETILTREGDRAGTDEAARKFYDETVKTLKTEQEVRARHILVETEAEAKAALDRIRKGEDFAKVAGELSKDPGSGKQGGDLGWFEKGRMVPEFGEAAFRLDKGQVSEPVKSQFGFHIIKVEDRRDKKPPEFEAVKDQLKRYVTQKAQQEYVLKLREAAKVERLDGK